MLLYKLREVPKEYVHKWKGCHDKPTACSSWFYGVVWWPFLKKMAHLDPISQVSLKNEREFGALRRECIFRRSLYASPAWSVRAFREEVIDYTVSFFGYEIPQQ